MEHPDYKSTYFPHWFEITPRFRDLDTLYHVNNAVFGTYFEEARIRFIHTIPELDTDLGISRALVVVHLSIDYLVPITYPSATIVGSRIDKTGNTSIHTFQACYDLDSKQLKATAESVLVWYDTVRQKPARLPVLNN